MPQPIPRGIYAFLGFFMLIGVVALGFGCRNLYRSLACARWPMVEGVIVGSQLQLHSRDADQGGDTYSPEVTYQYTVAGRHFESDRLAFGSASSSAGWAQGILNRYPVGQKVTVHYAPDDPEQSVLETGIHAGTWVCFGVGTVFVLVSVMIFQIFRAAARQAAQPTQSLPTTVRPDGNFTTNRPPALMGVIFILMGSFVFFGSPAAGVPVWILWAAGGLFVCVGIYILLYRLENKMYAKLMLVPPLLAFLAIFHWISFAPGERTGTVTTPFSISHLVSVRTPFAIFTVLLDLGLLAGGVHWLLKRRGK